MTFGSPTGSGRSLLKQTVREYALTLFDEVGFTSPAAPGHTAFVDAWLEAGYHGEMSYLKTRKRLRGGPLNSQKLLGKARSVIVVAQSYDFREAYPLAPAGRGSAGQGLIARYARGEDYHRVMWEKLNTLRDWLADEFPGTQSRGYTDSGPIRERELAARAGLGWQGKHTNLISLKLGNFFFLGALLTSLKLEPDLPFDSHHCGTCTRCLSVCPTGAIVAPMALDARRCISYLTIELHGSIPEELRPLLGDHIFGCDDCLAACPWNDKAQGLDEETFKRWKTYLADANKEHAYLNGWYELLKTQPEEAQIRAEAEKYQRFVLELLDEAKEVEDKNYVAFGGRKGQKNENTRQYTNIVSLPVLKFYQWRELA